MSGIEEATLQSVKIFQTITQTSIETASSALTKFGGAEEGECFRLLGKVIGREEITEDLYAIIYMFYTLFSEVAFY